MKILSIYRIQQLHTTIAAYDMEKLEMNVVGLIRDVQSACGEMHDTNHHHVSSSRKYHRFGLRIIHKSRPKDTRKVQRNRVKTDM